MTWLFVAVALVFQEVATTGAALVDASAWHLNLWIIDLIWFAATAGDIAAGFFIGRWIQRRFAGSRFDALAKRMSAKVERAAGRTGARLSLVLLGFVSYPYVTAFVASWLTDLPLRDVFLCTILGNALWYAFEWATVFGIAAAGRNYELIFAIIAAAGILLIFAGNFIRRKLEL
ncbi:MAG TPA: hypothetical protein VMT81_02545 [Candidatus Paceibacterota bacterium]|nr:hypothetical protein [Candidatus Paceibacterota bacterium]